MRRKSPGTPGEGLSVLRQRGRRVLADLGGEFWRGDYPAVLAEPQREPPDPAGVGGAERDPQPAVAEFLDALARAVLRDPPARRPQLELHRPVIRRQPVQALVHLPRPGLGR